MAPLVLAWYIVTELGSIPENAVKLGAPVPSWIVKIFDVTLKMADTIGNEIADVQHALHNESVSSGNEEPAVQNE